MIILLALTFFVQAQAADWTVPKARFLDGMKTGLPESFCADQTYFRQCFPLSKDDCKKAVVAAAPACLDKVQAEIPTELHQPADGQKWGEKIGNCVGSALEESQAKTKQKKPGCDDATKWK